MFTTLQQTNAVDASYITEGTRLLSEKSRGWIITYGACDHCAREKLKCTGKPGGCQQPATKRLTCAYRQSSKPDSPSDQKDVHNSQTADNQGHSSFPSPRSFSPSSPTNESLYPSLSTDTDDHIEGIPDPDDFIHDGNASDSTLLSLYEQYPSSRKLSLDSVEEKEETKGSCTCLPKILHTFQMVELVLMGAQQDGSWACLQPMDEALQCQKDALNCCEEIIDCTTCRLKPERITLVAATCSRLLTSIGYCASHLLPTANNRCTECSGENLVPKLQIGKWKPDEEDIVQVLRTLARIRVHQFNTVLIKLDDVVRGQQWPAHENFVRDLRTRFTRTAIDMGD